MYQTTNCEFDEPGTFDGTGTVRGLAIGAVMWAVIVAAGVWLHALLVQS